MSESRFSSTWYKQNLTKPVIRVTLIVSAIVRNVFTCLCECMHSHEDLNKTVFIQMCTALGLIKWAACHAWDRSAICISDWQIMWDCETQMHSPDGFLVVVDDWASPEIRQTLVWVRSRTRYVTVRENTQYSQSSGLDYIASRCEN